MTRGRLGHYWHLATFVVAVVALVLQIVLVLAGQNILDSSAVTTPRPEQVRRYFSYFTIQSNLLVAVATFLIVAGRVHTRWFRVVRLASLVGIAVTGVVAVIALPPSPLYTPANLLCDRLLHIVVPVLTVVGWLAFGPRGYATRDAVLPALAWPLGWLAATLALAPLTGWYPYPFLNVDRLGWGSVLAVCAGIAVLFVGLGLVAVWADRRLPGRAPTPVTA